MLAHVCGAGAIGNLQSRLARQFKLQAADWQDTCRALADWEDTHLVESATAEQLGEHAAILDQLERVGHWLEKAGAEAGFVDAGTAEQVQLTIQDLRDSRAMWHGNASSARRKEILRDCFNDSELKQLLEAYYEKRTCPPEEKPNR